MLKLAKLEAVRWIRSGFALMLTVALLTFSYTSILSSYYMAEILELSSGNDISFEIPDPTEESVFRSFLSNFGQLGLITILLVFAKAVAAGEPSPMRTYYAVRSRLSARIYLPKILAALCWVVLSVALTYTVARYTIWVLFPGLDFRMEWGVLAALLSAISLCLAASAAISVWSNSYLAAVLVPVLAVFTSTLFGTLGISNEWLLPGSLMVPDGLLDGTRSASEYIPAISVTLVSAALLVSLSGFKSLRARRTRVR